MRRNLLAALSAVGAGGLAASLAGCPGSDAPPACVTVDLTCAPLYEPTFDNVYASTLSTGCGGALSACHAAGGAGGMSLATPTDAYNELRAGRVVAGEPGCSELIVRTHSPGASYEMPPGAPLSAAEQCALAQWIAGGAGGPSVPREEAR